MSTAAGISVTSGARARGVDVYEEVCPRNLFLSTVDLAEKGPWVKTGPPVRGPEEVAAIWPMLGDGRVSVISSDHAAWTKENKEAGRDNIWAADGGIPQVQETLPLLLDAVNAGRVSLEDVVRLTSYTPARVYGLWPRKGAIMPGFDADLVVVDLDREMTVEPGILKSAVGYSAYENRTLKGWPVMTLVRGQVVMDDGEIVGPPTGSFVPRQRVTGAGQPSVHQFSST